MKRLERVRNLDQKTLAVRRKAHNAVLGVVRQHVHVAEKSVLGVKTKITGAMLERIVRLICSGCRVLNSLSNIRTSTAEIDLLIEFGPSANVFPMFKEAGTHLISEAKCYATGFKQEWVNELVGLMAQHQCSHSVLFVASPSKTLSVAHRHGVHIHSVKGSNVVPFGLKQLTEISNGANFLSVLAKQYIRIRIGATDLAI